MNSERSSFNTMFQFFQIIDIFNCILDTGEKKKYEAADNWIFFSIISYLSNLSNGPIGSLESNQIIAQI